MHTRPYSEILKEFKDIKPYICPFCNNFECNKKQALTKHIENECTETYDYDSDFDDEDEPNPKRLIYFDECYKTWRTYVLKYKRYEKWLAQANNDCSMLLNIIYEDQMSYFQKKGYPIEFEGPYKLNRFYDQAFSLIRMLYKFNEEEQAIINGIWKEYTCNQGRYWFRDYPEHLLESKINDMLKESVSTLF